MKTSNVVPEIITEREIRHTSKSRRKCDIVIQVNYINRILGNDKEIVSFILKSVLGFQS